MDANTRLRDMQIEHAVMLERHKSQVVRDMLGVLAESETRLNAEMAARLARFGDISMRTVRKADRGRLEKLIQSVEDIRKGSYTEFRDSLVDRLLATAAYEAEWQSEAIRTVIPIAINVGGPNAATLNAAIYARPFAGKLLKDAVRDLAAADRRALDSAIRMGFLEGSSIDGIVRKVRGTRAANYADGVYQGSRRQAEALTRTAVAHVAQVARDETWEANADIITGLMWVATLDGRTTPMCRSRDGEVFPVKSGPRPPGHWGCRSTMTPVLDGLKIVGNRPYVQDTRTRGAREIDFRKEAKAQVGEAKWKRMSVQERNAAISGQRKAWAKEAIGQTPAATSYQEWLTKQSPKLQDDILGKKRAALFREGVTLDKMVTKDGKQYTLQQLREREEEAFKRARLM